VDGTGQGSYPAAAFKINSVEALGSANTMIVRKIALTGVACCLRSSKVYLWVSVHNSHTSMQSAGLLCTMALTWPSLYIYSKLLRKTRHADIIRGDFSLIKTYRNFM
jgi:hypothetical protein